jgi:hyaluronoglucosaminidase
MLGTLRGSGAGTGKSTGGAGVRGIIEGFYGPPWSWDTRRLVCDELSTVGFDTYVYAPKDDPLHRDRWRDPYDDATLTDFAALVDDGTLRVGFGIAPGLSIDPDAHGDRAALLAKVEQVLETGVGLVCLALDDLPPADGLGERHGHLTSWLRDALPAEVELVLVPTHYTGCERTPYLDAIARLVPVDVPVAWTGRHVVNDTITAADARAWSDAMDGRRPLLWDNWPVNDAVMSDRLHTGPLRGREADLPDHLAGYLANPMPQARASMPALRSAAAWLAGDDPEDAWRWSLGPARVLAEGCDAAVPSALCDAALAGDDGAAEELAGWLDEAARCDDGGWGDDVRPWVEQLRAEAEVARTALAVLRADSGEAARLAPLLLVTWPAVRTSGVSVLGGRGGVRPMLGQDAAGHWTAAPGCIVPERSVCDRLVAAAFARL